jgi:hypothetical protein
MYTLPSTCETPGKARTLLFIYCAEGCPHHSEQARLTERATRAYNVIEFGRLEVKDTASKSKGIETQQKAGCGKLQTEGPPGAAGEEALARIMHDPHNPRSGEHDLRSS